MSLQFTLTNILFGVKFTDLCYGYHAFWRHCLDEIGLDGFNGFEIDTALYLQAVRMRLHIVDVPSFEGYRFYGQGKLQTIPDGFRVLNTILHLWLKTVFNKGQRYPSRFRGAEYRGSTTEIRNINSPVTQRLTDLLELMSILLHSGERLQAIMRELLAEVLKTVTADNGSLILLDKYGELADVCLVSRGDFPKPGVASWAKMMQNGLAGWVAQNRQSVLVQNTNDDPRWVKRMWDRKGRTAFVVPLAVSGFIIGILTLTRPATRQFTDEEVEMLNRISIASPEFKKRDGRRKNL